MKKEKNLAVDDAVYSEEALKLAAYVFEGRFRVSLKRRGAKTEILFPGAVPEDAAGEFLNEALNQQCRLDLMKKNSKVANIIVTRMLLSASGGNKKGGVKK
ncbi:MAG TPA: hypothetical protein DDW67_03770 [Elusimicrobia bacterium]|nr:hypothetical protein [Elusimicrobiota bacterium]